MKPARKYRREVHALLLLFVLTMLQSTFLNYFRVMDTKPDIILVSLVILVYFFDFKRLIILAFFCGLLRDALGILPAGFNTWLFIVLVSLVWKIARKLSFENKLVRNAIVCLVIWLNTLAVQFAFFLTDKPIVGGILLRSVVLESLFALALASPIYRLFAYWLDAAGARLLSMPGILQRIISIPKNKC